jgi:hypothetical protein
MGGPSNRWFGEAVVDRLQDSQMGLGPANKILLIAKKPQRMCELKCRKNNA